MSGTTMPLRSVFSDLRERGVGRQAFLFSLECGLGITAVLLVGFLTHWLQWLLPVAPLLYLVIIVPVALWCGFWQAAIVSLSAVGVQSYFTSAMVKSSPASDPAKPIELFAFILTALVISR